MKASAPPCSLAPPPVYPHQQTLSFGLASVWSGPCVDGAPASSARLACWQLRSGARRPGVLRRGGHEATAGPRLTLVPSMTNGTRDLYLSNTVRMHRKLRAAGVEAVLQVWEGQSHAQYIADITAPETREYHDEVARFFDQHLAL